MAYRMEWEDAFRAYVSALDAKKPVIICGDLNVAHNEIDLKNPKTNRRSAGFTDESAANSQSFWVQALWIPSAIFIRSRKAFIPGGAIALRQERRTQGGGLIIMSYPSD